MVTMQRGESPLHRLCARLGPDAVARAQGWAAHPGHGGFLAEQTRQERDVVHHMRRLNQHLQTIPVIAMTPMTAEEAAIA
jgi:hypothetical protein